MRGWTLLAVVLLGLSAFGEAAKCKSRYQEVKGRDQFIPRRGCRGLDSQIPEEYWTSVGYDGILRDGRTTDDFMSFPLEENNGHRLSNSFVGYWDGPENADEITRTKYGPGQHFESFGHVFVKPDGRVCGWFVGLNKEIVEVCGGFRVLSRNIRNPHEQIPFEWVQGAHLRNRDTLGFHRHRIAKYQVNPDEVFFGDAQLASRRFQGVSPQNERFVEATTPEDFQTKVWLLKKKNVAVGGGMMDREEEVRGVRPIPVSSYHHPRKLY